MKNVALYVASFIFLLVTIFHMIRYFMGVAVNLGTHHMIPVEWSLYAGVVTLILTLWMFIAARVKNKI